jgi:putative transcriptional regulator
MPPDEEHQIRVHLDRLLQEHQMTLSELAARVGVTVVNLSVLKNDRAKAIRFTTLSAICREFNCQPGDILSFAPPVDPPLPH